MKNGFQCFGGRFCFTDWRNWIVKGKVAACHLLPLYQISIHMLHILQIDDNTTEGRKLLTVLRKLSLDYRSVSFLTRSKIEALEDKQLLSMMEKAMDEGITDKAAMLSKLGLK